jgi:hypothetical protein
MLQSTNQRNHSSFRTRARVELGILPKNKTLEDILYDLKITKKPNVLECFGFLSLRHFRGKQLLRDYGLVSCQKVTQAFTQYLVDSLQNSTTKPMDAFKYHASGTDNTAESNAQTALITEVETRQTGTQIEGTSSNIYKSVATITYSASRSIVEHGLFSASTAGTLMDRSVFTAVPVENLDTIEFTYQLTVNAES